MLDDAPIFLDRRRRLLEQELATARGAEKAASAREATLRMELAPLPADHERARAIASLILDAVRESERCRDEEVRIAKSLAQLREKHGKNAEGTVVLKRPAGGSRASGGRSTLSMPSERFTLSAAAIMMIGCTLLVYALRASVRPEARHDARPAVPVMAPPAPLQTINVPGPIQHVPVNVIPPGYVALPAPPQGSGWAIINGPPGMKVFEKKRFLGTVPLVIPLPRGTHSLHYDGVEEGEHWTDDETVEITPGASIRAGFPDDAEIARLSAQSPKLL